MRKTKFRIKSWLWVLYPIIVVVFIAVSGNALLSNQEKFSELMQRQTKIEEDEARVAVLQQKLNSLENIDTNAGKEDLKILTEAVPPAKMVWALLAEIKLAATESGVTIDSYKGSAGDVKEATPAAAVVVEDASLRPLELKITYKVTDYDQVKNMVTALEKRLPLLRINKLKFDKEALEITVEGAWKQWEKIVSSDKEIPSYEVDLNETKSRLGEFVKAEGINAEGLGDTGVKNPF